MAQKSLYVANVALFEMQNGVTSERGNCMAAIVAASGGTLRYKLVCYNTDRQTLCAATITSSNEHSLQFTLQTEEYACFRDDKGTPFSMMFLKNRDVQPFCAHLGSAFFGASGQPSHSTVVADFAHTPKRAGVRRGGGRGVLDDAAQEDDKDHRRLGQHAGRAVAGH